MKLELPDEKMIEDSWKGKRWDQITRPYEPSDVLKLGGMFRISHTIAEMMSEKLWELLETDNYVRSLGAMTGGQAVQMVKAGLNAIYVSGWQVAADANLAGQTYPDQSLYPSNSVPSLVKRINNAFLREDQISRLSGSEISSFVPLIADAEAGFGGSLNSFELMKSMIEAGAAGVHFEDQLSSEKKCGHLGGKVLVPTSVFVRTLVSARLAADVLSVPTILIARTDSHSAKLITSDVDSKDSEFIKGERTADGFFRYEGGMDAVISRELEFAPYADLLWFETSTPDLEEAEIFSRGIHAKYPGKKFAYNCSPSFNWEKHLTRQEIADFQDELGKLGYRFQFITLAGFHALNHSMFRLASGYARRGMSAYTDLQNEEFSDQGIGYGAVKHQSFVGTGYFDEVSRIISQNTSSTTALDDSTEVGQFN